MIVRTWRGRAPLATSDRYAEHFRRSVLPALRAVEGFRGASLLRRLDGDEVEYLVLTRWTSMEVIRGFAGSDADQAVVEPAAVAALASYDRRVHHYEMIEDV